MKCIITVFRVLLQFKNRILKFGVFAFLSIYIYKLCITQRQSFVRNEKGIALLGLGMHMDEIHKYFNDRLVRSVDSLL